MLATFRRGTDETAWHFCENCSGWPDRPRPFDERGGPPGSDAEYCDECLQLREDGNCRLRPHASGFSR